MTTPNAAAILIIGASRGIGFELVRQYVADGCRVTATARNEQGLQRLRDAGAVAVQLDVADEAASTLAWPDAGLRFDTVIINAGVLGPDVKGLQAPSTADFDHVMHTNVLGPMRVLPQLDGVLAAGARLGIVSSKMGSIASQAQANAWLYRASKAAVNAVLKTASLALAGRATCIALHPGWVRTDMGGAGADLSVEDSARDLRRTLAATTPADNGRFINHDGQPLPW